MNKVIDLVGSILIIVGSIIAWAWLSQHSKLVEFFSYGTSIKFLTALWFVLAGMSLLCLEKYPRIVFFLGAVITLWAFSIFVIEYVYPYPIINNFLQLSILNTLGREAPAPNTCISFILIGIILTTNQYLRNFLFLLISLLCCIAIVSLSFVAIAGYVLHISTAYGWAHWTQMALLSAIGIFCIGLIFAYKLYLTIPQDKKILYLPISSFIFISIFSGLLSIAVYQFDKIKIKSVLSDHLQQNSENIINTLNHVQSAFLRFQARMENSSYIPEIFWRNDADSYIKTIEGIKSVALLNNNKIKMIEVNKSQNIITAKENILNCIKNIENEDIKYSIIPKDGNICFIAKVKKNTSYDYIVLAYDFNFLLKPIEKNVIGDWYSIGVLYKNQFIVLIKNSKLLLNSQWEIKSPLYIQNIDLYLSGVPSKELIREYGSNISYYLFVLCIVFAGLWSTIILYLIKEKAQESQIKKLNQNLQLILDSSHMSIITTDLNGIITHFNHAAERMLEYSASEMVNILSPAIFHDPAEIKMKATELTRKLGRPIRPGFEVFISELNQVHSSENEWTYISKSGKRIPVILSVTAMYDQHNDIYGYLGIALDISERKEVDHVKNEFISMVSHELRTPLTSIHGSLIILLEQISGSQTPESLELLTIALNNTDRLIRLINDILDLDKIESGRMKFTYKVYNVNEIIKESISVNQGYAKNFSVSLESNPLPDDVKIKVDHDRMIQVLTNLISNAIKFSPQNGSVIIEAEKTKSHVIISVIDKGKGIPPDFQKVIFNKFSQADSSPIRKQQGTGLGLSISKLIVETMEGSIYFETKENVGTSFKIKFPVYSEIDSSENDHTMNENEIKPKILHIEDDTDLYKALNAMIKKKYILEHVNNIISARKLLTHEKYQLVILDLKLQDGYSFELLPYLQNLHTPVIVLSAYELPAEYEKFVKKVLIKSKISNEEIIKAINETIMSIE